MSREIKFLLNNNIVEYSGTPAKVLLDFIRKDNQLTGSKEVCKEGDCGACAVIMGSKEDSVIKYKLINSCLYPLGNVANSHIVTIEGINVQGFTPIQQEFIDQGASQCGFCTPGFVVALTCYFLVSNKYNLKEAIDSVGGNICRCTGYMSIKRSINNLIIYVEENWNNKLSKIENLVLLKILPEYFLKIYEKFNYSGKTEEEKIIVDGEDKIISGGTDLFVQQPDELLDKKIVFGNELYNNFITETEDEIIVGGQVTFEQMNHDEIINKYLPSIKDHMHLIASLPIRNSATLAGNLVNASPIGDMSIYFLGLNSRISLKANNISREMNLKDFYLDYKKLDKKNNEIVEQIKFNKPRNGFLFNFEKISKRVNLDIASVNSAISLLVKNDKIVSGSIAFGGVAPVPLYLNKTSALLSDREINTNLIELLIESAQNEISPISDIRGSKRYKRLLVSQMLKKHFLELFPKVIKEEVFA
jgi:xanthine dehydrogenase small subunit